MRILVTGTEGQLARALAVRAQACPDIELIQVGRPQLDLEKPHGFAPVLMTAAPDLVINAAAHTGVDQQEDEPERAFRMNADAPAELARLTGQAGIPLIHISTDYVFDGRSSAPYVETDQPNPRTVYGRSKLAGEEAVRDCNGDHLIVRTAWVVSPYGRNFIKTMLALAQTRESLQVVADQFGNPTEARDLADGLLAAVYFRQKHGRFPRGLYHLAGRGRASWHDLAQHVLATSAGLGGPTARVDPISSDKWPANAARPGNSELCSDAFERDFGYRSGDWRECAAQVVAELLNRVTTLRKVSDPGVHKSA